MSNYDDLGVQTPIVFVQWLRTDLTPEEIIENVNLKIGQDAVFFSTDPLLYHKFGNMLIFW